MSTSATFKYRGPDKRCPFPFNRDATTSDPTPGRGGASYVDLTASGGDEGLAEACRLWWLIESVTMTPTGTADAMDGGDSFTCTFSGSVASSSPSLVPYERVQTVANRMTFGAVDGYNVFEYWVAYVSSKWRLYYFFVFAVADDGGYGDGRFVQLLISNQGAYASPSSSGTFSLFGYTLSWESVAGVGGFYTDPPPTPGISGVGLSATSTFYTLV